MRKQRVLAGAALVAAAAATGGVVVISGAGPATRAAQERPVNTATAEREKPAHSSTGAGGNQNVTDREKAVKLPRWSPKQQSDALKFAQCMRENGVKDFPDPVNGEHLVDTTRIPSANRPGGMSILRAAMQTCAVTPWERQWGG